jgi:microcystin-dependent protein
MAYIGEIRAFAFDFAPRDWLICDGRELEIDTYSKLYSIIGSIFSPDHKSNSQKFRIPNLIEKALIQAGQAKSDILSVDFGKNTGESSVTLSISDLPAHNHSFGAFLGAPPSLAGQNFTEAPLEGFSRLTSCIDAPVDTAVTYRRWVPYSSELSKTMAISMVTETGGGQPHENMSPYLVLNYCICYEGEFPIYTSIKDKI